MNFSVPLKTVSLTFWVFPDCELDLCLEARDYSAWANLHNDLPSIDRTLWNPTHFHCRAESVLFRRRRCALFHRQSVKDPFGEHIRYMKLAVSPVLTRFLLLRCPAVASRSLPPVVCLKPSCAGTTPKKTQVRNMAE